MQQIKTGILPLKERKRRLDALCKGLTFTEKGMICDKLNRGYDTLDNYLKCKGSNYVLQVSIIEIGEQIIKDRK